MKTFKIFLPVLPVEGPLHDLEAGHEEDVLLPVSPLELGLDLPVDLLVHLGDRSKRVLAYQPPHPVPGLADHPQSDLAQNGSTRAPQLQRRRQQGR